MKSRKPILYLAILFAIVCLYQLSFTWKVSGIEDDAAEYALTQIDENLSTDLVRVDSTNTDSSEIEILKDEIKNNYIKNRDIILENLQNEYIKSISVDLETVEQLDIWLGMYTFQECKEREINLGLDLKGGMNVTLEVSVKDVIIELANKRTDENFRTAIKTATKAQESSQLGFVELFGNAFPDSVSLSDIFHSRNREEIFPRDATNEQILEEIKKQTDDAIESSFEILRSRIDRFGVTQPNIQKTNVPGRIIVELPGIKDPERAKKLLQSSAQLEFWETFEFIEVFEDLQAANDYLAINAGFEIDTTELVDDSDTTSNSDTLSTDEAAEKFAEENPWFSLVYPNVNSQNGQINSGPIVGYVALKDTATVNSYINDIDFMNHFDSDIKFVYGFSPNDVTKKSFVLLALRKSGVNNTYIMDGGIVEDASQVMENGRVSVSMNMNSDGANKWKEYTGKASEWRNDPRCIADGSGRKTGKSIAIVLDGYAKSWPTVNEEIPNGRSSISGDFDVNEGKDLANVLKSGKLPAPANITQEAIVGPSLGKDSIDSGLKSFMIALLLVLAYMILYYSGAGIVSNIALLANIFFIFGVLASLGAVLTLPGIAGIVLTIGMSVDANVLIYERIREELANKKGIRLAISDGYKSAYTSIIDANVTTLLTGIILFVFGSGPIKGFATTLIIGILTSLFCAIFITRLIISARLNKGKSISFSTKLTEGAFKNINIDFIGKRKIFYVLSSVIILFGGYSLATKGLDYGIDFKGGRSYIVSFENEVDNDLLRNELSKVFDGMAPSVNEFNLKGQAGEQLKITTKFMIDQNTQEADALVRDKLFEGLNNIEVGYTIESQQKVGPTIADDIRDSALMSVVFSLIVIFLYILIRFKKWQFSLGAVVAVFHDVLIVLSVFSIFYGILPFSLEIDQAFIAAILTIIGYSLNDTVVVFDRVREHMTNFKKKEVHELINGALNSTLSRTINTSLTTFFVLLIIFIFGGEVIKGFMFALMVGVVVGTYSSLFVASPIMMDTIKRKEIKN